MKIRQRGRYVPRHAARPTARREILEWSITLVAAAVLALAVHLWVGGLITVSGPSMQPTLWDSERVLMGKIEYYASKPKRGDIVIVKYPGMTENIIKRVIATAGERLSISGGAVFINGKKLDEPYIKAPINEDFPETVVPDGTIFVMGDNRNDSMDSRFPSVGPIPLTSVLGRAYTIVWPFDKWKKLT